MKDSNLRLLIHATNVTGLGASQVAAALIGALSKRLEEPTLICVPNDGSWRDFRTPNRHVNVRRFARLLPRVASRAVECLAPSLHFPPTERTLVLGDIPLRGRRNQALFVQQAHLIKPAIDTAAGSSSVFRVARFLFGRNLRCVSRIIAQTEPMKAALERSYPLTLGRIEVIAQPPPDWVKKTGAPSRKPITGPLWLFYPAAGYPHKNHQLLRRMHEDSPRQRDKQVKVTVTLPRAEAQPLSGIHWIANAGRLAHNECLGEYHRADALFFPSLLESYPLPLIEAMTLGLPVVCADRPYARWICESEAIYFDPRSSSDAWRAIGELKGRLISSWRPDWSAALAKLPRTWDEVAERFLAVLDAASNEWA